MIGIIIVVVILVFLVLYLQYRVGKTKPSDQRTSFQSIACTVFTVFHKNVNDTARAMRSPEIMKEEAMQEVNTALRKLEESYKQGRINLKVAKKKLDEEVLPKLKDEPGKLEGKARQAKDKYEKSKKSEGGVIEQYKQNAIRFLQMKQQALDNIEKAKKQSIKLQTVLDTSEAQYDSDKAELEMIKSNLECVVSIPQLQVRESVNRINSIQRELTTRMNEDTIRADVEREIQSEQNTVTNSDLENEFERL